MWVWLQVTTLLACQDVPQYAVDRGMGEIVEVERLAFVVHGGRLIPQGRILN